MIVTIETYCKGMDPISVEIEVIEIEEAKTIANEILNEDTSVNKVIITRDEEIYPLHPKITYTR